MPPPAPGGQTRPAQKTGTTLDLVVLILIPLMTSFTPIAVGAARNGIPSFIGGVLRFTLAAGTVGSYLLVRGGTVRVRHGDWWKFILLGIITVPINQYCYWEGVENSDTSHGAMIYAATPVMVLLMTCLLRLERWTINAILGALFAMAGVLAIMQSASVHADPAKHYAYGDFLLVWATLTWSMYLVGARLLGKNYSTLNVQWWTFSSGVLISIPLAIYDGRGWHIAATPQTAWIGLGYLGIVSAGLTFFMFNWAMMRQPPSRVATVANIAPLLTVVWNVIYFHPGQELGIWFVIGSALLLSGMGFALWRRTPVIAEEGAPLANAADLATMEGINPTREQQ